MGKSRRAKRIDATGRNPDAFGRENAVMIIRRSLWQSPRISAVSPAARALFVELLSMYNGSNNGRLFLSVQDATDRLGFSDWHAAAAAFGELKAVDLIAMSLKSYFDIKTGIHSRARAWRLKWIGPSGERLAPYALLPFDDTALDARSGKRLERRQSALKRYFKEHESGKFAVVDSTTLDARSAENAVAPVVETTTLKSENGSKEPKCRLVETTTYLSYHRGTGSCGWWGADATLKAQTSARLAMWAWIAAAEPMRDAA